MLLDAGIQPNSNCASRAIGYRQAGEALQRWHADPDSVTEQSVVIRVQLQSRCGFCMACCSGGMLLRLSYYALTAANVLVLLPNSHLPLQIQAVQAVQAASRQLCHKQMTWFRDEEMFR